MSDGGGRKGLDRAVEAFGRIEDPLLRVDATRQARERLERSEAEAIRAARDAGVTWKAIGALYGLSKQGAQQRFRSAEREETGSAG